jgi:Uma2 family endonuclease
MTISIANACPLKYFIFSFPGVPSTVPRITIELPERVSQTKFNLKRWAEILTDPTLVKLPNRIETDRHGHILMSPPPAFRHSRRQGHIIHLLNDLMPDGRTLPECPLSTADGVKAIDLAWLAANRPEITEDPQLLTCAPEICVEIFSPSNSPSEINEKRILYFDAGAGEVWVCAVDGSAPASSICRVSLTASRESRRSCEHSKDSTFYRVSDSRRLSPR